MPMILSQLPMEKKIQATTESIHYYFMLFFFSYDDNYGAEGKKFLLLISNARKDNKAGVRYMFCIACFRFPQEH